MIGIVQIIQIVIVEDISRLSLIVSSIDIVVVDGVVNGVVNGVVIVVVVVVGDVVVVITSWCSIDGFFVVIVIVVFSWSSFLFFQCTFHSTIVIVVMGSTWCVWYVRLVAICTLDVFLADTLFAPAEGDRRSSEGRVDVGIIQ